MSSASVKHAQPPVPGRHALTFCQLFDAKVTIAGNDSTGTSFVDQCTTIAIAHDGLIVRIARTLAPDQELAVRLKNSKVLARVMNSSRDGTYSLCFDRPQPEFWDQVADSPDAGPPDTPPAAIATDPLLVSQAEQFETLPVKSSEPQAERRRSARIPMRQSKACIESAYRGSEIAELINVSRGGICFRSPHIYPLHSEIRVAAPYTEGSMNVFVPARIVRVHRDFGGGIYGVEYTR